MPTQEWMCQGCGNMNGRGMTAIPSSCMRCGLLHTARSYPAYDPRTGKVVDAPSLAARSPAPSDKLSPEGDQARRDARMLQRGGHPNYCRCDWCRVDELADDLEAAAPGFAKDRAAIDKDDEYDEASAVALQVLCRVFEDGADVAMEEWREWYKPEQWLWHARGLGTFIASRLASKRELTADERGAFERLQAAMHLVSDKAKPVEITMRDANCLVRAIAQPPRSSPPDQHPGVDALIRNLARAGRRAWDEGRYVDYQHFTHAIKALRARPLEDPEEKTDG